QPGAVAGLECCPPESDDHEILPAGHAEGVPIVASVVLGEPPPHRLRPGPDVSRSSRHRHGGGFRLHGSSAETSASATSRRSSGVMPTEHGRDSPRSYNRGATSI